MEIKIQCECGTRFAFDVEPVNGRMPVRVSCPECSADATEFANEAIREKLAAPSPPPPPPVPETPVPAPARQPMRIAVPVSAAATAAAAPESAGLNVTFCPRHSKNPAVETCRVCGKPICEECMESYGYACSTYCRKRAEETGIELPVYGKQRAVIEARIARVGTLVWRAALGLAVIFVAAWVWYTFFLSHPRVIYSETLPHGDRARYYHLLGPGQLLEMRADRMTLFDLGQKRNVWSVPLDVGFSPSKPEPGDLTFAEDVTLYPMPRVIATTNDLWILFGDRLIQYDRRSGNNKQEIPLHPPVFSFTQNGDGLTVVSGDESGHEVITRIAPADGSIQTEPIESTNIAATVPASRPKSTAPSTAPAGSPAGKLMAAMTNALPAKPKPVAALENLDDKFVVDGDQIVRMKTDLLERKTITRQAMKTSTKKSLVDNNLTAGQSLEATEQMMNDMRRQDTGGVEEEDVSRYRVTLHRLPDGGVPDWTGEVTGEPSFFALKTLNVLIAGNSIQVFDKQNKALWSASLTYSVAAPFDFFSGQTEAPCVESGNNLYVFDRGMLTSFDARTGEVHWRLTSVGISRVQLDDKKNLYVTSTVASPDSLQFSQQVSLSARSGPVILKVDAATGKVLWRCESIGDTCYVSGKFVYVARASQNPLATMGEDPGLEYDIYRLSPADGHAMWDYSQSRHPVQVEVQGNEILLHFRGELQVLKFLSL